MQSAISVSQQRSRDLLEALVFTVQVIFPANHSKAETECPASRCYHCYLVVQGAPC